MLPLALFTTVGARGQRQDSDDPSSTVPTTWQAPRIQLDEFGFDLQVESGYDHRNVRVDANRRRFRGAQQNERAYIEETVGMRAAGTLLDERFLRFDTQFRFGLRQESYYERLNRLDRSENPSGTRLEYDFALDFLPAGSLPISVYGLQQNDRLPRPFLPTLDRTRERYGATMLYNHDTIPMRFEFEHEFEQLFGGADRYDDERRSTDALHYEADWRIADDHHLRFRYDYEDRRERYPGLDTEFDLLRHAGLLEHDLRFGQDGRHSWYSFVRMEEESGRLARDMFEASTRIRWQATRQMTAHLGAQVLEDRFDGLATRTWRGDGGITQRWDDWTATLNLYGRRQDLDARDGRNAATNLDEWGGIGSLAYGRDNELGRLTANLSYSFAHLDARGGRGAGVAIRESLTFRGPRLTFLREQNVRIASVIVTDLDRGRVYRAGRDYTILRVGRFVALQRNPAGRIGDRETVLVQYRYRTNRDYALDRHRADWRVQQDFGRAWSLYYAGSLQNENISRDRWIGLTARRENRHRLGATYRAQRWSAGLELEHNDENIDPFSGVHLNGEVALYEDASRTLRGQARLSHFWFDGSNRLAERDVTWLDLGITYRHELRRNLAVQADAAYRFQNDGVFGRTHGYDIRGAVEYSLGQFDMLFEVEYDALSLPRSTDDAVSVYLLLKRDIPIIGRRS